MSFQIKNFVSIVAAQVNYARGATTKVTDFQEGSVVRTLMEAPAVEVEELYLQMFLGLRDAIPVATFLSFGFDLIPAARAAGYVSISVETAPTVQQVVPAGTVFNSIDGRTYTSLQDVVWLTGQQVVRVPVAASTSGAVGNAAEGIITSSPAYDDTYTISNSAITTGRDVEKDSEREARFADFVASLSQGTVAACRYKASRASVLDADGNLLEYVTRLGIQENPGYVVIYIYSNIGTASAALIADCQAKIDGNRDPVTGDVINVGTRAAGVRFAVISMTERAVPLSIKVEMFPGYVIDAAVRQQLGDKYSSVLAQVNPETTLYLGTVIDAMLAVTGIKQIVPVTESNIACAVNEVLTPGTLTIAAL